MGSSGSELVDFAIGSIVWVRRRNGSWWPGKILGPHDLSNNHLMSPRSGTPVKLLGREDASVDWYNLEKSKRVKAFRCGDFDECIERAESAVGIPSKKREKYARREDAILHALELEKQLLDEKVGKLDIASDTKTSKSSISGERGSETSLGNQETDEHNTLERVSVGICASPVRGNGFPPLNKMKEATMMPEDEAPPKMRDLQEFGLRTISSKRKHSSIKADEFERPHNRFQAHITSGGRCTIGRNNRATFLDDRKVSPDSLTEGTSARGYYKFPPAALVPQKSTNISSFRGDQAESHADSLYVQAPDQNKDPYWEKRNRCMYLPTESNGYVSNTNELSPTLKQVSHFPVRQSKSPHHISAASDDNASEFSEDTETDASDSDDSETDSDEINAVAGRGDEHSIETSEAKGRLRQTSNEELDDLALASEIPSADDGVSKWKSKGKRNIRNTRNRSSHIPNARVRMNDQTYLETRGNTYNNRVLSVNYQLGNDLDDYVDEDDSFDGDYWSPRNIRHSALRHMPKRRSNNNFHIYDWNSAALEHPVPLNGYIRETQDYYASNQLYISHGHVESGRRNMLIEVDLKVQSSYPKHRVPIISLMSKLDGRAIIGHSLQIEEIAEGASDSFISKISEEADYPVSSNWKTTRRATNDRLPRLDLSSAVDNSEDAEYIPLGRKSTSRDLNPRVTSEMHKLDPNNLKPAKKLSKIVSTSSSQKTRTLSSFSTDHQNQQIDDQGRNDTEAFSLTELMKSESERTNNVPYIPVKLVFSRLYEAVCRVSGSVAPENHEATKLNTKTRRTQQQL